MLHPEVGEVRLDRSRERLRRCGSERAKRRHGGGELGIGDLRLAPQPRLLLVGRSHRLEGGARLVRPGGELVRVDRSVASRSLGQPAEPRLHVVEPTGLRLELLQVAAQLDARLPQARDRLLQIGERGGQARVELRRALELVRRVARQRQGAGALLGVHALGGIRRGCHQAVEVTQAVALDAQRRLLPCFQLQLVRVLDERPQRCQLSLARSAQLRERLERAVCGDLRGVALGHARAEIAGIRRAVEQVELHARACQPARLVLRDDLEESTSEQLEIGTRARAPEHERTRTAVRTHATCEQQLVLVVRHEAGDALGHELGRHLGKGRLDVRLRAALVRRARHRCGRRAAATPPGRRSSCPLPSRPSARSGQARARAMPRGSGRDSRRAARAASAPERVAEAL